MRAKDVEVVLSGTKHTNKSWVYEFIHPFLKTGLLTSNGKKWFERRKILTPPFHFNILQQFYTTFKEQSDNFIRHMKLKSENENEIDVHEVVSRFTLNVILGESLSFYFKNKFLFY